MQLVLNDTVHFEDVQSNIDQKANIELIKFEHTDSEALVNDLKALIAWENNIFQTADRDTELFKLIPLNVSFKTLSLENKIEVFRTALTVDELVNSNLLLNLFMLITSNTKYHEDSVYTADHVILGQPGGANGLEEFLDIKISLKPELEEFYKNITKYYLSCLCSLHYKETDVAYDNLKIMPVKYNQILSFLTFEDLSRISRRVPNINELELEAVYNAKSLLQTLVLNQFPTANFLELFSNLMRDKNE